MGQDVSTERSRDRWLCSVVVRACREEGTTRQKAGKKIHEQKPHSATGGRTAQSEREAGDRGEAQTADGGPRVAQKKNHCNEEQHQQRQVTTWGKGKGNGGRGGQEEGPTRGPKGNTPSKRKGAGRGRPVLGSRTRPGKALDPVGPRQRVADGQNKNGMQGKGEGTEKGVWLEPHDGPRGLGRQGRRHRSKGRGREGSDTC